MERAAAQAAPSGRGRLLLGCRPVLEVESVHGDARVEVRRDVRARPPGGGGDQLVGGGRRSGLAHVDDSGGCLVSR